MRLKANINTKKSRENVWSDDCLEHKIMFPDRSVIDSHDQHTQNIGDSRYVDFAYLDTITCVEVIFQSQHFFSIYLCILCLHRKRFTWSNGYLEVICHAQELFSITVATAYVEVKKSALTRAQYCLFRLCKCITWGATIFQTMVKNN